MKYALLANDTDRILFKFPDFKYSRMPENFTNCIEVCGIIVQSNVEIEPVGFSRTWTLDGVELHYSEDSKEFLEFSRLRFYGQWHVIYGDTPEEIDVNYFLSCI